MPELPALYTTAQPGSILWNAGRAMAFADLKDFNGGSFAVKARQSYGAALTRMRLIANDSKKLTQDGILAALLLIDKFELIYLSRRELLGPHKNALKHILYFRGEEHFQDRVHTEFWRAAQQRLQAQRITQRDDSEDEQLSWISKPNASLPDLHVCVDVEKMVVLCSAGRKLMQESDAVHEAKRASELLKKMREVVDSMQSWGPQVDDGWRPQRVDIYPAKEGESPATSRFTMSPMLQYSDPWLAYKWNFHAASQIVLRQSMVEIMEHSSNLQDVEEDSNAEEIAAMEEATIQLATTIIGSCVPLLGFSKETSLHTRGKMAKRFFAVCALWVVQQARFTSTEQKETATEVLEWIDRTHRLG